MKRISVFVFFVILSSQIVFGQNKTENAWESWIKVQKSDVLAAKDRIIMVQQLKQNHSWPALWCVSTLLDSDNIFDELGLWTGISVSQILKVPYEDSIIKGLSSQIDSMTNPNDPFFEKMTEEDKTTYLDLFERKVIRWHKVENDAADQCLTSIQKKKSQEIQIMLMSSSPFVNSDMFNALDLSEKQKSEMEKIYKRLEPDFDNIINDIVETDASCKAKIVDSIEKMEFKKNSEFYAMLKSLEDENIKNDDFQKAFQKRRLLVTKFKIEMCDVLTDVQIQKMDELISNPPAKIKDCIKMLNQRFSVVAQGGASAPKPQVSDAISRENPESEQVDNQESD